MPFPCQDQGGSMLPLTAPNASTSICIVGSICGPHPGGVSGSSSVSRARQACSCSCSYSLQPTSHSPQPRAHSPQPAAHSPQSTAHSPQPTAHSFSPCLRAQHVRPRGQRVLGRPHVVVRRRGGPERVECRELHVHLAAGETSAYQGKADLLTVHSQALSP